MLATLMAVSPTQNACQPTTKREIEKFIAKHPNLFPDLDIVTARINGKGSDTISASDIPHIFKGDSLRQVLFLVQTKRAITTPVCLEDD